MNALELITKFNEWKSQQNPSLNPTEEIQKLLNSGEITQAQYEQARSAARALYGK